MAKIKINDKEAKSFRNRMYGSIADKLMKLKQADDIAAAHELSESIKIDLVKAEQSFSLQMPEDWLLVPGSQEKLAADLGAEILNNTKK